MKSNPRHFSFDTYNVVGVRPCIAFRLDGTAYLEETTTIEIVWTSDAAVGFPIQQYYDQEACSTRWTRNLYWSEQKSWKPWKPRGWRKRTRRTIPIDHVRLSHPWRAGSWVMCHVTLCTQPEAPLSTPQKNDSKSISCLQPSVTLLEYGALGHLSGTTISRNLVTNRGANRLLIRDEEPSHSSSSAVHNFFDRLGRVRFSLVDMVVRDALGRATTFWGYIGGYCLHEQNPNPILCFPRPHQNTLRLRNCMFLIPIHAFSPVCSYR